MAIDDRSSLIRPHPEQAAHDWYLEANRILHTRLNYWLVTEGLLLTAFAAATESSLGSVSWDVRFAIAIGGLFFTAIWHSFFLRIWHWSNWYFERVRFIHSMAWGQPLAADDASQLGVYPPSGKWKFYNGGGLSVKYGAHLLMAAFYVVWYVMTWASWGNLPDDLRRQSPVDIQWVIILVGVFVLFWTLVVELHSAVDRSKKVGRRVTPKTKPDESDAGENQAGSSDASFVDFVDMAKKRWEHEDGRRTLDSFAHIGEFLIVLGVSVLAIALSSSNEHLAGQAVLYVQFGVVVYAASVLFTVIWYRREVLLAFRRTASVARRLFVRRNH